MAGIYTGRRDDGPSIDCKCTRNAIGTVLEGQFGEAGPDVIDSGPDSELAADAMGIDVEGGEGAATTADGGIMVDDDDAANIIGILRVSPNLPPFSNSE